MHFKLWHFTKSPGTLRLYLYVFLVIFLQPKSSRKKTATPLPHHLLLVESLLVTDRQALWHPALVIEGNYKPWRELWQWGKLLYSPPPGVLTCRHTEINCYKTSDELDTQMHIVKLLERRRMKQCTSCDFALMLMSTEKTKETAAKRSHKKKVDPFQQIMFSSK